MKEDDRCDNCTYHDVYCDEHTDKNGVTTKYHDGCICGFEGAPYSEVRKIHFKNCSEYIKQDFSGCPYFKLKQED